MATAYTPGLQVTKHTTVTKVRELPLPGKTLVRPNDRVQADSAVLSAELPGDLDILRVASRMGLDPITVVPNLRIKEGDHIKIGDLVCEAKTFFGLFRSVLDSPMEGEVEFITEANAHIGIRKPPIPLTVNAYIEGIITDIDEGKSVTITTEGSLIQGIFGVGGERQGKVFPLPVERNKNVSVSDLEPFEGKLEQAIIIGGAQFDEEALRYAAAQKASGVVTGSIDARTLAEFVGFEIGVSITGDEDVPFTFIITEGFGELPISERVYTLARDIEGQAASLNGATQVRAGAMRPEVIAPLITDNGSSESSGPTNILQIGSRIRIIRVPYFGKLAAVTELPQKPLEIPTGAKVRVLKAKLDTGEEVIVPRANVELVE